MREFDAPIFADTAIVLVWTPEDAGTFDVATTVSRRAREPWAPRHAERHGVAGQYVTICAWRRRRWKVILDPG